MVVDYAQKYKTHLYENILNTVPCIMNVHNENVKYQTQKYFQV